MFGMINALRLEKKLGLVANHLSVRSGKEKGLNKIPKVPNKNL